MKALQIFLQILMLFGSIILHAQDNQWTWVGGDHITETFTNYGTKGIAAATNHPGPRSESTTCTDRYGNFWLFGGAGKDATGKVGILNDLWKWDGTYWTWISGSNLANQAGNFGNQGIASSSNIPPSRTAGISGFDNSGNLWLFGGSYDGNGSLTSMNDLWKWDGNNWTWIKGSSNVNWQTADYWGYYGTYNIAAVTNTPGGRSNAVGWTDSLGNLWIYGGNGYADSSSYNNYRPRIGIMNDLWKWDGINWTWIQGNKFINTEAIHGIKGVPNNSNNPGCRYNATIIKDKNGSIWLFGGSTYLKFNDRPYYNDLWKWDGINWTWVSGSDTVNQTPVFGQMGIPAANNIPEAGISYSGWADSSNNLYLFGGISYRIDYYLGLCFMGTLWKWDGTNWTWIRGDTIYNSAGKYGIKNVGDSINSPASRSYALNFVDKNGHLFLMGGAGVYNTAVSMRPLNDTWFWDGSNWIWTSGASSKNSGSFGTKGITAASNQPSARYGGVSWQDNKGDLWLFGGAGNYPGSTFYNDLWKWDGINWTWINGSDKKNQSGIFGIRGITTSTNMPGGRSEAQTWYDNKGILWLFGGNGRDVIYHNSSPEVVYSEPVAMNDFWKWDGVNWTWVNGPTSTMNYGRPNGIYGQKGIADSANIPTGRYLASCWTDKKGNCWLYGGYDNYHYFNELWKWDGINWTWMDGDSTLTYKSNTAVYGIMGIADAANSPGSRANASIWKDSSDNVYLFGGTSNRLTQFVKPIFNDLWKWDGKNWTWLSGSNIANPHSGHYGNKGISAATNLPPEREGAASWTDNRGNLWLYGGNQEGTNYNGTNNSLNDLWVWDGKNWTWISGDSSLNSAGDYGTQGLSDINNKPAARTEPFYWTDKNRNSFWLFGGNPNLFSSDGYFNDLWIFKPGIVTAIPASPSAPSMSSKILLLNNPSSLDRVQFRSDQFYQKLNWQIIDESGRMLQEGKLYTVLKGSFQMVQTQHLINGNYFIRFLGDDKKMQTLKWIKE